jgi:hypothetical protein
MYLFNETVGIDQHVEAEWLDWMKSVHIPDVMMSGMFTGYKMYRILHVGEEGTVSYSVQYFSGSIEEVKRYLDEFAPPLVERLRARFKDQHVVFRTLLEEVVPQG